jgi:hypothetical protein
MDMAIALVYNFLVFLFATVPRLHGKRYLLNYDCQASALTPIASFPMARKVFPGALHDSDYPIEIRDHDMSVSVGGDVIITGKPAEKIRRWLVNYPGSYMKDVVPFIRAKEASFKPTELWIDGDARIHITNRNIVERIKRHLREGEGGR